MRDLLGASRSRNDAIVKRAVKRLRAIQAEIDDTIRLIQDELSGGENGVQEIFGEETAHGE